MEVIRNKTVYLYHSFKDIVDETNLFVKHSKRVKGNVLLKITYKKSQTDTSRYSTAKLVLKNHIYQGLDALTKEG